MWGWESCEIVFASRSKRCRDSGVEGRCDGSTLIATVLSRRVSRARYTSPMPPAPMGASTSYGPRRDPAVRLRRGPPETRDLRRARAILSGGLHRRRGGLSFESREAPRRLDDRRPDLGSRLAV